MGGGGGVLTMKNCITLLPDSSKVCVYKGCSTSDPDQRLCTMYKLPKADYITKVVSDLM